MVSARGGSAGIDYDLSSKTSWQALIVPDPGKDLQALGNRRPRPGSTSSEVQFKWCASARHSSGRFDPLLRCVMAWHEPRRPIVDGGICALCRYAAQICL